MSRHRIVRTMDYNDEYDGYDDVYGHSVDDENSLSPTDASQWIYDRARGQQSISAFIKKNRNIEEEDENNDDSMDSIKTERKRYDSENFQIPILDEIDQVKLTSCIDEIRSVVGDSVSDRKIVELAMEYNFDFAMTLDAILNEDKSKNEKNIEILPAKQPLTERLTTASSKLPTSTLVTTVVATAANDANIKKGFKTNFDNEKSIVQSSSSSSILPKKPIDIQQPLTTTTQHQIEDSLMKPISKVILKENVEDLYKKERGNEKDHLYMIVIGHVDAGKSTLMGHLLYDTGNVSERVMNKHEHESKKIGKQSFAYAWVLDETGEERNRGITMDVGMSRIETPTKSVTLLDAPGHKDFIPNMISGASQADVALLVVDATRGEFETGFEQGGQTREHALLVRSLGVSQLGVVINKLDTVDWSQERFDSIVLKLKSFLKQAGFKESEVTFIPCSGLTGENLYKESKEPALIDWYKGPTLYNVIDTFKVPKRSIDKPLRMSVSDIFKRTGSNLPNIAGRIETGVLSVNDKVLINPIREQATVKGICIDDISKTTAFAGDQVSITLSSNIDINNVLIGHIVCDPLNPISITQRLQARILVFNMKIPITIGFPVLLHHQSLIEPANICKLIALLHKGTGEVIKKNPRMLGNNSCALIEIETTKPICVEKFSDIKELGRIMLRVGGVTIAAGMITKIY